MSLAFGFALPFVCFFHPKLIAWPRRALAMAGTADLIIRSLNESGLERMLARFASTFLLTVSSVELILSAVSESELVCSSIGAFVLLDIVSIIPLKRENSVLCATINGGLCDGKLSTGPCLDWTWMRSCVQWRQRPAA